MTEYNEFEHAGCGICAIGRQPIQPPKKNFVRLDEEKIIELSSFSKIGSREFASLTPLQKYRRGLRDGMEAQRTADSENLHEVAREIAEGFVKEEVANVLQDNMPDPFLEREIELLAGQLADAHIRIGELTTAMNIQDSLVPGQKLIEQLDASYYKGQREALEGLAELESKRALIELIMKYAREAADENEPQGCALVTRKNLRLALATYEGNYIFGPDAQMEEVMEALKQIETPKPVSRVGYNLEN